MERMGTAPNKIPRILKFTIAPWRQNIPTRKARVCLPTGRWQLEAGEIPRSWHLRRRRRASPWGCAASVRASYLWLLWIENVCRRAVANHTSGRCGRPYSGPKLALSVPSLTFAADTVRPIATEQPVANSRESGQTVASRLSLATAAAEFSRVMVVSSVVLHPSRCRQHHRLANVSCRFGRAQRLLHVGSRNCGNANRQVHTVCPRTDNRWN